MAVVCLLVVAAAVVATAVVAAAAVAAAVVDSLHCSVDMLDLFCCQNAYCVCVLT